MISKILNYLKKLVFKEKIITQDEEKLKERNRNIIKSLITIGALFIILIHVRWPTLSIDGITITLLIIAIIPWLGLIFKSLEFPGGWKIEYQEFIRARNDADKVGLLTAGATPPGNIEYSFQRVAKEDPKLGLAGLRLEIETTLREIANSNGIIIERESVGALLRILRDRHLLSFNQQSVLADMVGLLNAAVHGRDIDNRTAEWALDIGPNLLNTLKSKISVK